MLIVIDEVSAAVLLRPAVRREGVVPVAVARADALHLHAYLLSCLAQIH